MSPRGDHLGGHHDHVGRLGIGLGQRLFQHEEVLRRADGHQLAVGLRQAQRRAGRISSAVLLVELLQVLDGPPRRDVFSW